MTRLRRLALAGATLLLASGCHHASTPVPVDTLPVGTSTYTLDVGGISRTYRVYRPADLPPTPVPLVVMLHGALGDGQQAERSYGWDKQADRDGFVVAYPDGYRRTWNVSTTCCGPAAAQDIDDVDFISGLVAAVSAQRSIDPSRVYAAGISNGGMLTYRLACDTTLFAGIGPDSATMINDCPAPRPTSVIHIHGTADQTIPYRGGPGRRDNGGDGQAPVGIDGPPVPDINDRWRTIDDCADPVVSTTGRVTTSVADCPMGRGVELVTIDGAGHQWPGEGGPDARAVALLGLDPPAPDIDATDVIWRFFAAHPATS